MSFEITKNFVDMFGKNFHLLAQQTKARIPQFIRDKRSVQGQAFTVERAAPAEANDITTRHADTPLNPVSHSRRYADMKDSDWAELIDQLDQIKLLADPTSTYVQDGVAALNRKQDQICISALLGSVRTDAGTSTFPAAQQIANGGTGLTLAKLRSAHELLDDAEQNDEAYFEMMGQARDKQEPWGGLATPSYVLLVCAQQITNLLADSTATSGDYNTIKALVSGSISTFMGFQFVRMPGSASIPSSLPKASTVRSCIAFSPRALAWGTGKEASTRIAERPDKRFSVQVYATQSYGAVRKEDAGVVQVDVVEV